MPGMHQTVDQAPSASNIEAEPVLHAIDYEDVALSHEGARLVHHGARAVMQQYMPAADFDKMTRAQAVALFIDKIFWEENSGGLIMCTDLVDKSLCLPIPSTHWKIRGDNGIVQ